VRYGFIIDQRKCIGCHACTVACKEENPAPLGVNRTWVKYIEKGTFPDTRRYFTVMRCNHCDNAPCVTICPTVALYRRPDGIVDFDGERGRPVTAISSPRRAASWCRAGPTSPAGRQPSPVTAWTCSAWRGRCPFPGHTPKSFGQVRHGSGA
jgi:ferredoxin